MSDPLSVACPDCYVAATVPCHTNIQTDNGTPVVHAERNRLADLRALEHGTCALCGQPMVRGAVEGRPPTAWHPIPYDAQRCPPIPDPSTDWNGYAEATNAGLIAGYPGAEHFTPETVETCEIVNSRCEAPAGFAIGGGVVSGTVAADFVCHSCGRPVCGPCSVQRDWYEDTDVRICNECDEEGGY